jgi:hypothetical protein
MISNRPIWKIFNGILALILVFPSFNVRHVSAASTDCPTLPVRLTLASEQIEFCSPTSLPYTAVEDNTSVPNVSYGGLDQRGGYGLLSIKAASPGYGPGPARPAYNPGEVEAYRQANREVETSQSDHSVGDGPSANLWGESVPGMQVELILQTSQGDLPLISVEWLVEHNHRLWSITITWDTTEENSAEWEAAAENFSLDAPVKNDLPDTALDLGATLQGSQSKPDFPSPAGIVDVPLPSWWNGSVCDDTNYFTATGIHSIAFGSPWHGVYACGTDPIGDMETHWVQYYPNAHWENEFQCVELVMRFFYLQWGIGPWQGSGSTIKNYYPAATVDFFPNNGNHPIFPGDIITEDSLGGGDGGHAMLVTDVDVDGVGTGTISIMEQNSIITGRRNLPINGWAMGTDPWTHKTIQGWLHAKANEAGPCYTLTTTASPPAGGSIVVNKAPNCPDNKYISGTVLSLTPVPNTADEYQFISWSGGASGSTNPLSLTMTTDKSITADFLNPPDAPVKVSPANGATNQLPNLNLSWTASARATSYEYCLYITNPDDCEAAHGNWISTGAASSASVTGLALSTTYHWQVRARNQVDTTDGSGGYWVFTVGIGSKTFIPLVMR